MLTLNQIVSQITNLATAHNQIAESGVGDFAEWQAKERTYPILWVFHESTAVSQMEIAFSIRLICADRVIVGEEGDDTQGHEQEVISDTLLVLLDFLAYFQQNHSQPYDVVTSATIDPFTERLNDRLAGNSVTITIRQPFDWNKCQIPQTGASIPPTVDGLTLYNFCDPAVIARLTDEQVACLEAEYGVTCLDGTVNITNTDADPIASVTVASGGVEPYVIPNVAWTDSDGSAESTPYGNAIVCTLSPPSGSVSVAVSNATPTASETITITATAAGFTPTNYLFFTYDGSTIEEIVEQAGGVYNWVVDRLGNYDVYVLATDGVNNAYNQTFVDVQGDPDAVAFLLATGITDSTITFAISNLVADLKIYGLWTKMKAIYPMVGGTAVTHKYNLKNPVDTDAGFRLLFSGAWTHSAQGALPNGVNAYADTRINPSLHLLTTPHWSYYSRTIRTITRAASYGVMSGSNSFSHWPYSESLGYISDIFDNSVSRIIINAGDSSGFIIGTRLSSASHKIYRNGIQIGSNTSATLGAKPNGNYVFSARNVNGVVIQYDILQIAFYSLGDGLSDTDASNYSTAVQAFQTTLGRQV